MKILDTINTVLNKYIKDRTIFYRVSIHYLFGRSYRVVFYFQSVNSRVLKA